jgi:hypothetical protein
MGYREIMGQVLSGAENYPHLDFAPERCKQDKVFASSPLAHNSGTGDAS